MVRALFSSVYATMVGENYFQIYSFQIAGKYICEPPSPINQMTLLAYDGFELLKRSADINIIDFINEFERFHNNMENTTLNL